MAKILTKQEIVEKLKSQKLETKVGGNKITVFTSEDRRGLMEKLSKLLGGKIVDIKQSSIGAVKVGSVNLLVKPAKKASGAGSGAGAYITALAESAQCYYCAAKWYGKDYKPDTLRKYASYVSATSGVEEVIKNLPDHWVKSCIMSADALHAKYGSKKLYFHRGSALVDAINANFSQINKTIDFFSNINKWSPADIWMFSAAGLKQGFNFKTFQAINNFLIKSEKAKDVIGVSLKQTISANVRKINFNKRDKATYEFTSYTLGKKGFFDSGDVYIMYDGGEIQFRGFSPTWQGEIKGKTANHGKVSGGPIRSLVKGVIKSAKMDAQPTIESQAKMKNKTFYKNFHTMYTALKQPKLSLDEFTKRIQGQNTNWQACKFLGTQLIFILSKNPGKRQAVVSSLINYAKSQSDYSAPHIKVE